MLAHCPEPPKGTTRWLPTQARVVDGYELVVRVARTESHGLEELDALGAKTDLALEAVGFVLAPARFDYAIP